MATFTGAILLTIGAFYVGYDTKDSKEFTQVSGFGLTLITLGSVLIAIA